MDANNNSILKNVGLDEMKGHRKNMEDISVISILEAPGNPLFLAVYDGHNGKSTANYLATRFHRYLTEELNKYTNPSADEKLITSILEEVSMRIDEELFLQWKDGGSSTRYDSGSTACIALIFTDTIYVSNCGDCRCVMSFEDGTCLETIDHKANLPSEAKRINHAGSYVQNFGGVSRVGGVLAISRAFGDFFLKNRKYLSLKEQAVTAFPDVTRVDRNSLESKIDFLIAACDGVWDKLSTDDVVTIVRKARLNDESPRNVAAKITNQALIAGSQDNLSCIIEYL